MADQFRYDKAEGTLWLEDTYAITLRYIHVGYWRVGEGAAVENIAAPEMALRAAQSRLRTARAAKTTDTDRAVAAMDAAMTAAGVAQEVPDAREFPLLSQR